MSLAKQQCLKIYQNQINSLRNIKDGIHKYFQSVDISPIDIAIADIESRGCEEDVFCCEIKELLLDQVDIKRTKPHTFLRIDLGYNFRYEDWKDNNILPFNDYKCHVTLYDEHDFSGLHIEKTRLETVPTGKNGNVQEEKKSNEFHPTFHLHFSDNGNIIERQSDITASNFLMLDSPRLPFPPFDLALCLHFCLTQYYTKDTCKAFFDKNPYLISLIQKSQDRIMPAFYAALQKDSDYNPMILI